MPRLPTIRPGKSLKIHTDARSLALYQHLKTCGVLAPMRGRNGAGVAKTLFAREHPDPAEPAGYWLEVQLLER